MKTRISRDFARAFAEVFPDRVSEYVERYGNEPAPDMLPSIPVEDTSRPFASDDLELSAAKLVGK